MVGVAVNWLTLSRSEGLVTLADVYTYNAANQLTSVNGETLSYDANGNLTGTAAGAMLEYNAADQTVSVLPRPDQGLRTEHTYRGAGQAERTSAGPVARTLSTGGWVCVPLFSCVGDPQAPVATSIFGHTLLGVSSETTVTDTAQTTTWFTRDADGRLLGARTPNGRRYYLTDSIGTVVGVTDAAGGVVASYRYDPFGQTTSMTGTEAAANPWRFAGAYQDASGLYKMGQRYYHPTWGRWTQQDPLIALLDPLNWNRYAYAGNNPINYTDPTGFNAVSDWASCMGRQSLNLFNFFSPGLGTASIEAGATVITAGYLTMQLAQPQSVGSKIVAGLSRPVMVAGKFVRFFGIGGVLAGGYFQYRECF